MQNEKNTESQLTDAELDHVVGGAAILKSRATPATALSTRAGPGDPCVFAVATPTDPCLFVTIPTDPCLFR